MAVLTADAESGKRGSPSATDVAAWRSAFPVTERYAYLDNAGVGPLPRPAASAVAASLDLQARRGSLAHGEIHEVAEVLRRTMGQFLGVSAETLAAVGSTSAGISVVAMGIDWRAGDNVIVAEIEFPSVIFPWMALAERGVEVRRVVCPGGCVDIASLLASTDSRTRVVAVSWVQFSTGFRIDLGELGHACHSRGIMLIVDGMQGVGALSLDLSTMPVDAFATQSYKWLLSPHGVGWLYLHKNVFEHLQLSSAGPRTVTARQSFLDHRFELRTDAQRFESGILNFHAMAGALASLRLLSAIGIETIETRVLALAARLAEGLRTRGFAVVGQPGHQSEGSGIVVCSHPRIDPADCQSRLLDASVVTSVRGGRLRISPHFFNTEDEVDLVLSVLAKC